jgi:hypothetical protein
MPLSFVLAPAKQQHPYRKADDFETELAIKYIKQACGDTLLQRDDSGLEGSRRSEISEISCSRLVISAITAAEWRPAVSLPISAAAAWAVIVGNAARVQRGYPEARW